MYATSETATIRNYFVDPTGETHDDTVPIGYPIEGKSIVLLDEDGNPVESGDVGEIAVKSRYFAVGYWRQSELTKAKFLPGPKGGDGANLYTGDLGCMIPDGWLMHKGRKDFRVKVRGYEVEIGDLEKALLSHKDIKETVVVTRYSKLGEARLHAYFTTDGWPVPSVSELRAYLKEKLPNFMIPSRLMWLGALPLTAGGKVDRRALPDPGNSRPELDTPYVASQKPGGRRIIADLDRSIRS